MSQRNSDTLGLSEADFAALATARQSDEWPTIYQTSTSPTIDYGSRRKDDGKAPIEPKSKSSSSSGAISASEYYSNVTIKYPNQAQSTIPNGPPNTESSPPWENPFQTHGLLPTDSKLRKKIPLWSGLVKYFPDALVAVAAVSQAGNDQHNPGKSLHWDRTKSMDQEDTLLRHLLESGTVDTDGHRHSAKVAWRALAMLQLEIERNK